MSGGTIASFMNELSGASKDSFNPYLEEGLVKSGREQKGVRVSAYRE